MNDAPNRSAGPNWVETPEGEILPPDAGLDDAREHQLDVDKYRAEQDPDYVEWTDINPAEYDLDEAAITTSTGKAVYGRRVIEEPSSENGYNDPLIDPSGRTKSELDRIARQATPEIRERYRAGAEAARQILRDIQARDDR